MKIYIILSLFLSSIFFLIGFIYAQDTDDDNQHGMYVGLAIFVLAASILAAIGVAASTLIQVN